MIITDLTNLESYKAMSKNMRVAIEYLESINLDSIEDGTYPVLDDDIFVVVSTYITREHGESKYEAHRKYIDIQTLISGEEMIFCNQVNHMEPDGAYNIEKDKLNFKDQAGEVSIHLKPGMVTIFYPSDVHKACCNVCDEPKLVRKLVAKVKLQS